MQKIQPNLVRQRAFQLLSMILMLSMLDALKHAHAQRRMLDSRLHHLRNGIKPEWSEFPLYAEDSQLVIRFNTTYNATEQTIYLRQYDVGQNWRVLLNDNELGQLTLDEKDMTSCFIIPRGALRSGNNTLVIGAIEPFRDDKGSDDIRVGEVYLEDRPMKQVFSEANVDLEVYENNQLIPARITVVSMSNVLQHLEVKPSPLLTSRTGVIYTGNGKATFGLRAGIYKIYASRGMEYSVDSLELMVQPGDRIQKRFKLIHELSLPGWVNCDPHVHTLTHSGHGDATIRDRVLTIAGEGIELPVITEHNKAIDLKPITDSMNMSNWFLPLVGDELTTAVGHFNLFKLKPSLAVPDHQVDDWNSVSQKIRQVAGIEAIILNHPRDIHNGFRPLDPKHHIAVAGMSTKGWTLPANAMEVMNSGSQQTDPKQLFIDWMGMMNHGNTLTPVGSSDSHDVSRFIVGQARTYIRGSLNRADSIETNTLARNFLSGKVMVGFGLLPVITVNAKYGPGEIAKVTGPLEISLKVMGPSWMQASRVTVYANGMKIREAAVSPGNTSSVKWEESWTMPKPEHDLFLVALAEGPGWRWPYWPIAKPYQHASPMWNPIVMGCSGAIWIDADGDGKFTNAYGYAKDVWQSSNGNLNVLFKRLSSFDEAVAIQAAAILAEEGMDPEVPPVSKALQKANSRTKNGFYRFIKDWRILKAGK